MNLRRDFLKRSSLAGAVLLTRPDVLLPKSRELKLLHKLEPTAETSAFVAPAAVGDIQNMVLNRATFATYFDAGGTLRYSDQNLFTYSQDFQKEVWSKQGISISDSSTVADPSGSKNAQVITETTENGEHRLSRNINVFQGLAYSYSVYLKAGSCSKVRLSFANSSSYAAGNPKFVVDLRAGSISSVTSNVTNYSINDQGNGWWRVSISGIPNLSPRSGVHIFMIQQGGSTINYAGARNNLYIWGAQFETGYSANPKYFATTGNQYNGPRYNYDPSTQKLNGLFVEGEATNLLRQSELLNDSTVWLARNTTVKTNRFLSPDGFSKAVKVVEDRYKISHYLRPVDRVGMTKGEVYTFSAFLRASERKWAYFMVDSATIHFDLTKGSVGSGTTNSFFISSAVQQVGNGWFRCCATFVASSDSMSTAIGMEILNGAKQYTGDGDSGIYIWGPQLETGAWASSYIPTGYLTTTRAKEECVLKSPDSSSTYDVFVQRTNGGVWVDKLVGDYTVPASRYEIQTGSFWESNTPPVEKEEIAQSLFPAGWLAPAISTARLNIFGNDYRMQSANKSWSINLATNKVCQMFRFQVNSGDQWSSDAGKDKERSEVYSLDKMPFNQDVWLSYAVRVADGDPVTSTFCHLGQFHATEDSGEAASVPVLTFRFSGKDTVTLTTCANTDSITSKNSASVVRYTGKLKRGVWVKHVMRIRFSHTNGQLQWWENGVQKLNLSGVGIGNNDKVGPYWKFGVYRTRSEETLIVEYANMELSLSSLRSRVLLPLLII